jgi:hypothetical protein
MDEVKEEQLFSCTNSLLIYIYTHTLKPPPCCQEI